MESFPSSGIAHRSELLLVGVLRSMDLTPPSSFSLSLLAHEHRPSSVELPCHSPRHPMAGDTLPPESRAAVLPCTSVRSPSVHLWPCPLHCCVRLGTVVTMVVTSSPATSPTASSHRSAPPALQRVAGRWGRLTRGGPLVCASGVDLGALHRVHPAFSSAVFFKGFRK